MNRFRRRCEELGEDEPGDEYEEVPTAQFPHIPIFDRMRSLVTRNLSSQRGIPKRLFPDRMSKWSDGGRRKR
ncbi:hypothetical protein KKA95_00480 [Patescibacteria group bacterium]|nr:hypothetical protein [Patescibacteria group bacterium]